MLHSRILDIPYSHAVMNSKKRKVGSIRYEARSRGRVTPWHFERTKPPDNRFEYCLDCTSFYCKHQVLVFTVEWNGPRPMGEQWSALGPMSIHSELDHLAFCRLISVPEEKARWLKRVLNLELRARPRVIRSTVAPH